MLGKQEVVKWRVIWAVLVEPIAIHVHKYYSCIMRDMKSLNQQAIMLRKDGLSYGVIADKLKISKSTASLWLGDVQISEEQKLTLHTNWINGLVKAREFSILQKHEAKRRNIAEMQEEARNLVAHTALSKHLLEIFLAGLYLGDGFKSGRLGLGNADPKIVRLFVDLLRSLYPIQESKFRIQIFARADQTEEDLIEYWSQELSIPETQFQKTQFDKRTSGSASRDGYHGVCAVNYSDASMQRRILAIGQEMIKCICKGG